MQCASCSPWPWHPESKQQLQGLSSPALWPRSATPASLLTWPRPPAFQASGGGCRVPLTHFFSAPNSLCCLLWVDQKGRNLGSQKSPFPQSLANPFSKGGRRSRTIRPHDKIQTLGDCLIMNYLSDSRWPKKCLYWPLTKFTRSMDAPNSSSFSLEPWAGFQQIQQRLQNYGVSGERDNVSPD